MIYKQNDAYLYMYSKGIISLAICV